MIDSQTEISQNDIPENSTASNLDAGQKTFISGFGWGPAMGPLFYVQFWSLQRFAVTTLAWLSFPLAVLLDRFILSLIIGPDDGNVIPIPIFTFFIAPTLIIWSMNWSAKTGRQFAWQTKPWDSFEQFRQTQSRWDVYGILVTATIVVMIFLWMFTDLM